MTTAPPVSTDLLQVMAVDGTIVDPAFAETVPDDDIVALYAAMLAQRVYDDRMIKMQRQGRLGFYLACTGEEVCSYGPAYALRPDDWLYPAYREPGTALWRGMPFQAWVDNMVGNVDDPVKGRQMPVHWTARAQNVVSISSPVGTQIPQCTGTAYAMKVAGKDSVACCFFGEGTSSEGDFHVGLNFAGVWKAPAIFFCRNNKYAISTPYHKTTAVKHIVMRASGYGIRGQLVDGNDLLGVIKAVREAAEWARQGKGPTLLEAKTYRLAAHSTSDDPKGYRTREEEAEWAAKDPLIRLKAYLIGKKLWDKDREKACEEEASTRIIDALTKAEAKPNPLAHELFDEVFAEVPPHLVAQRAQMAAHLSSGLADHKPKA
jgi:TPP-dependent pyruvate/acetoin dehydrogenase alpha subunit